MKITITDEIEKVITNCPYYDKQTPEDCENHCPLIGVCVEYWTGDSSENQED